MNASVALQDQLKTIEISALIYCTCIASICHVYMKFSLIIYQGRQSSCPLLAKLKILPGSLSDLSA